MKQARDYRKYNVRLTSADWQRGSCRVIRICNTLLAKKLCDSSFLGQNLDLIHSHFKTNRVMSFIF